MKAAVAQDWFFAPGGSEQVALGITGLLPGSDVYTSFLEDSYRPKLRGHQIHTWPLQRLVGPTRRYRSLLPLYPLWFSALDLRSYDLVVSSSGAFAKAVRTRRRGLHIAYIHTPMRFAWDLDTYLARSSVSVLSRLAARTLRPALARWDRQSGQRPDVLVANSEAVRDRIRLRWDRDSEVIHPPVQISDIEPSGQDDGFLIVAARLLAYRRIDLLIEATSRLDRELVVVGDGPELSRLRSIAGPSVRFAGSISRAQLVDHLRRCHAYVVPGEEDFGIAPVEAMAAGKPVIAYAAGGALETVVDGQTGVFFDRQTPDALAAAIEQVDAMSFDRTVIRANAERFSVPVFRRSFVTLFERLGVPPELYIAELPGAPATIPSA